MGNIKQLKEKNVPFYPLTIPDAIVFENGDNLSETVSNLENELTKFSEIEELIPEQATPQNQLADKEFVNSSIATNTAQFRGTFNSIQELSQVTADLNDYAFVVTTDLAGNTLYDRFKYNGTTWVFEYTLNNSSFTAQQWASINSGITTDAIDKLNDIDYGAQVNVLEGIKVNDVLLTTDNKKVNIDVPTKTSDIINDSEFVSVNVSGKTLIFL